MNVTTVYDKYERHRLLSVSIETYFFLWIFHLLQKSNILLKLLLTVTEVKYICINNCDINEFATDQNKNQNNRYLLDGVFLCRHIYRRFSKRECYSSIQTNTRRRSHIPRNTFAARICLKPLKGSLGASFRTHLLLSLL